MKVVGRQVRPVDWVGKTAGTAPYASDAAPENTLATKVLRSPYPHAKITRLDVSKARTLPGVHAVITAADFGDVIYEHSGESYSDRPPMAVDRVLFVGQEVAAVAADNAEIAAEAVRLIDVRYRRLPALLSVKQALAKRARPLHDRESGTNVALGVEGVWGGLDVAKSNAVASASGTFVYPRVAHACMEPNTTVAWWHDDRMELWTSSQAPHFVVHELARVLHLELDQVVCRDVSVGGGFGSKSKVSEHEALAAMLSMKCGKPVSVAYSREEEMAVTKPRHEFTTQFEAHVDADGRMCLFEAHIDVDNGAYNHYGPSVMRAGIKQLGSMYRPDAVVWAGQLVDTHLPPGGQFRGYGTPQTALALESVVDQLAEGCGVDPIEFRIANASQPNTVALAGAKIGSNRLVECLHSVRELLDWDAKKADPTYGRGVGVAAGMHSSGSYAYPGGNVSAAGIEVTRDGDVVVRFGGADAGTGQRTVLAQIAAEILAVPLDRVTVIMTDWDQTPPDMGAWSSRGTHMGGHATRQAAEAMAEKLRETAADKLGTSRLELVDGQFVSVDDSLSIGDAASLTEGAIDGGLRIDMEYLEKRMEPYWTGIASPNISASYTFAAHAVEVEVDTTTGEPKILDYVAAHDIGRAINPGMVKGQIIGGAVQGLGAVLGEEPSTRAGGSPTTPTSTTRCHGRRRCRTSGPS
ncbi:xanthine dehydrogenase family protein molybdopterin-binding subunit [Aeromicrobium sp. UC242_57]|uniref:xanthine dehydrogenase family protein molybdopterin-binding subunit n=1 Tax=Aeromicrobium sp. UC242_57 TaxID=3374624 RepID=UPI0037AD6E09